MEEIAFNWPYFVRWLHVVAGILWVGLLWYFNFVQIPAMPGIPDEHKPGVSKHIAPRALFFFRWAALATIVFGLLLAWQYDYIADALSLSVGEGHRNITLLGIGMWLGIIMMLNVWLVIWPKQKVALGLVEASAEARPKAARTAMLVSRTNFVLSFPMLYCMVGYQNL